MTQNNRMNKIFNDPFVIFSAERPETDHNQDNVARTEEAERMLAELGIPYLRGMGYFEENYEHIFVVPVFRNATIPAIEDLARSFDQDSILLHVPEDKSNTDRSEAYAYIINLRKHESTIIGDFCILETGAYPKDNKPYTELKDGTRFTYEREG